MLRFEAIMGTYHKYTERYYEAYLLCVSLYYLGVLQFKRPFSLKHVNLGLSCTILESIILDDLPN